MYNMINKHKVETPPGKHKRNDVHVFDLKDIKCIFFLNHHQTWLKTRINHFILGFDRNKTN